MRSNTHPSVAVIIPCYNAERWVRRAIQSALDQDYPNLEVIVIDDGSRDSSLDVIRSFGDKVRWETGSNGGACVARNRGLALTDADYVVFLDADDWLEPGYLRLAMDTARSRPDVVLTSFVRENSDGTREDVALPPRHGGGSELVMEWLRGPNPCTSSMVLSAPFLRTIGGWSDKVTVLDDFELGLRLLSAEPRIARAPEAIAVYFQWEAPQRLSRRTDAPAWRRVKEILDVHGEWIGSYQCPDLSHAYGRWYYHVARRLYQAGDARAGKEALAAARRLGFSEHTGSLKDRVLIGLLGIRGREALGRQKRQIRRVADRLLGIGSRAWR